MPNRYRKGFPESIQDIERQSFTGIDPMGPYAAHIIETQDGSPVVVRHGKYGERYDEELESLAKERAEVVELVHQPMEYWETKRERILNQQADRQRRLQDRLGPYRIKELEKERAALGIIVERLDERKTYPIGRGSWRFRERLDEIGREIDPPEPPLPAEHLRKETLKRAIGHVRRRRQNSAELSPEALQELADYIHRTCQDAIAVVEAGD